MEKRSKYPIFLGFAAIVFVFNLLVMNDVTSIWNGAEASLVLAMDGVQSDIAIPTFSLLPLQALELIHEPTQLNEFYLRLPGLVVLLLTLFGFYTFGRKLFGQEDIKLAMLIIVSSFLIPFLAKMATGDVWLMCAQVLALLSLIFYLKQSRLEHLICFYSAFFFGLMIHPMGMLISTGSFAIGLLLLHPKRKAMQSLLFVGPAIGILGLLSVGGIWNWQATEFLLLSTAHISWSEYFMALFLGLLPWLGFMPSVLWDWLKKLKAKEELAIIGFCWLLAGVLSRSALPQWIFALLISKHIWAFLSRKYPYSSWVITFGFANLILSFFAVFMLIMSGYLNFSGLGFRSAVGVGVVYWVLMTLGAIGILGRNKSLLIGGLSGSALLGFFLFWINLNPFIEGSRGMAREMVKGATELNTDQNIKTLYFGVADFPELQTLKVYAFEKGFTTIEILDAKDLSMLPPTEHLLIVNNAAPVDTVQYTRLKKLNGRLNVLDEEQTFLILGR